jgi:hypothetical protein
MSRYVGECLPCSATVSLRISILPRPVIINCFTPVSLFIDWRSTDVSEDHVASIFLPLSCHLLTRWFLATCYSEMSVDFQRTARRYIETLHNHRCQNIKSYVSCYCLCSYPQQISGNVYVLVKTFGSRKLTEDADKKEIQCWVVEKENRERVWWRRERCRMPGKKARIRPHTQDQVTLGSRQLFSGQEGLEEEGERNREVTRQTHCSRCCIIAIIIINIKWR